MTQSTPGTPGKGRQRGQRRPEDPGQAPPLTGGISMCGAPSSGKTTFAAALTVALERHPDEPWRLRGITRRAGNALGTMRDMLVDKGEFPGATTDPADYDWQLVRPDPQAGQPGPFGMPRRDRAERVPLNLVEGPGGYQNPDTWGKRSGAREFVEKMTSCSGFVFIYDPVSEAKEGNAFQHTSRLLSQLDSGLGGGKGGYLPQHLAMCVTKFDDPRVYASAKAANLVDYDYAGDGSPYVDPDHAEEFFVRLCLAAPNPSAQGLPRLLRSHFHPKRIRFYVTSAIGFYVDPFTDRFDDDDFVNVIQEQDKMPVIRGAIRPLNVMEPVLWLAKSVDKNAERPQP